MGKKHRAAMCPWLPIQEVVSLEFPSRVWARISNPALLPPGFHFCPGRKGCDDCRGKPGGQAGLVWGSRPMLPPFSPTLPASTSLIHTHRATLGLLWTRDIRLPWIVTVWSPLICVLHPNLLRVSLHNSKCMCAKDLQCVMELSPVYVFCCFG